MAFKPLFKGMRATNILIAFILNAFVAALIATIIVEVRTDMNKNKECGCKEIHYCRFN